MCDMCNRSWTACHRVPYTPAPGEGAMTIKRLTYAVLSLWIMVAGAASAGAQQFTGGIRGALRDANGVIPGVTVTLTNEATKISRDVVTNETGQYNFPAVTPGTYTLRSRLSGYKTFESKGLIVGTQQFLTLDIVLEAGGVPETVTGTSQTPPIPNSHPAHRGCPAPKPAETLP